MMKPDTELLKLALRCVCPRCKVGSLFKSAVSLNLCDACDQCSLDFSKNDSADGPAVFLIFILGTLLVPLAWIFEYFFAPPSWVHLVLWTPVALGLTVITLRPLKAYIIALQFKHRPGDWE